MQNTGKPAPPPSLPPSPSGAHRGVDAVLGSELGDLDRIVKVIPNLITGRKGDTTRPLRCPLIYWILVGTPPS